MSSINNIIVNNQLITDKKLVNNFINIFKRSLKDNKYMLKVLEILEKYKITNFSNYNKKHIMYMYIMTELYGDIVTLKIGYTFNIIKRYSTLCNEYKSDFILIGIKNVNSEQDELEFHNYMNNLPNKYNIKYNNKSNQKKMEIYKFHEEVNNYTIVLIEQEKTKQEIEKTKQIASLEETKQEMEKTKQEMEKTKQLKLEIKLLTLKNRLTNNNL